MREANSDMKRVLMLITTAVFLLSACGAETGIEIHDPWIRPAAKGENGAVYLVIHNHSSQTDELIGVSSDVATAAEMHESRMNGDIMQMHKLESVPLEAYAEIEFAPGRLHVMLVALKNDLEVGNQIEVILHFKNFQDIKLTVPVRETAEENHGSEDH